MTATLIGNFILAIVVANAAGFVTGLLMLGRWAGKIEGGMGVLASRLQDNTEALDKRVVTLELRDERERDFLLQKVADVTRNKG
jgi:hypothetical protein